MCRRMKVGFESPLPTEHLATIVILLNVFASLCRYVETVLDAVIVIHSLFDLQYHDSFSKDYFGRLVAAKILLVVAKYGGSF